MKLSTFAIASLIILPMTTATAFAKTDHHNPYSTVVDSKLFTATHTLATEQSAGISDYDYRSGRNK